MSWLYKYDFYNIGLVLLLAHLLSFIVFKLLFTVDLSKSILFSYRQVLVKGIIILYLSYYLLLNQIFNIEFSNIVFEIIFNIILFIFMDFAIYVLYNNRIHESVVTKEIKDNSKWFDTLIKSYRFLRISYIITLLIRIPLCYIGYYIPITPNEIYERATYSYFYHTNDRDNQNYDYRNNRIYMGVIPVGLALDGKEFSIRLRLGKYFTKTYYISNSVITDFTNYFFSKSELYLGESNPNRIGSIGALPSDFCIYDKKAFNDFRKKDSTNVLIYFRSKPKDLLIFKKNNPNYTFIIKLI